VTTWACVPTAKRWPLPRSTQGRPDDTDEDIITLPSAITTGAAHALLRAVRLQLRAVQRAWRSKVQRLRSRRSSGKRREPGALLKRFQRGMRSPRSARRNPNSRTTSSDGQGGSDGEASLLPRLYSTRGLRR